MRHWSWWPLVVAGVVGAGMARCSSGAGGDAPGPIARCEADLSALTGTGSGSKARVAAAGDLLQGEAASGRVGDVLLANDRIRVLIEAPNRTIGPAPFGGNIIDADLVRADGTSQDRFGELGALFQFGRTVNVERLDIVRDGSQGGAAVVAATGRDAANDFINLKGMIGQILPGLQVPDADLDLKLRITRWYVLEPGSNAVHVVDAFCNDTDDVMATGVGDLVDSGGEVQSYSGRTGFSGGLGSTGGISGALGATPGEPFVAWVGEGVTYGVVPMQDRNQVLTVAGVTATLYGAGALLDYTNGPDAPPPDSALIIDPKSLATVRRDFVVGEDPGAIFAHWRKLRGVATGTLSGAVLRSDGTPAAAARVYVRQGENTAALATADATGHFAIALPAGESWVSADDGVGRTAEVSATIAPGATATIELKLPATATLVVHVKDAAGAAIPAKITIVCDGGACPSARNDATAGRFRDVAVDKLPTTAAGEVFAQRFLNPDGELSIVVPPGKLRVYASRGPEWSLFDTRIEPAAGETATLEPRLEHVVDTTGWMSGDFHVHGINSPDSPVPNLDRLRTFLGEGTDVIVSTDHDYVTDYAPLLARIPNGDAHLRSLVGVELTTFDYGHFNAFPLVADPKSRNGGAVDWAGGLGASLTPREIFLALQAWPGDQVVQLNHARGGYFSASGLDTRTLWTRTDPKVFRIAGLTRDTATGDTRLFDDHFTAMEVQNGLGDGYLELLNDWMTFLSRGLRRTATSVSDTHKRHGGSGTPRTWVQVGNDDPKTLDPQAFASAVNAGRAFGSNGPVLLLTALRGDGSRASLGDTVTGANVTFEVEVRTPAWMQANEVSIFSNATGTETNADGKVPDKLPEPATRLTLEPTAAGGAFIGKAQWKGTFAKDAWVMATVSGTSDMFPVTGKGGATPFAYTNAIFVDVGGDGWTPPIDLAAERAAVGSLPGALSQPLTAPVTEGDLRRVLGADPCHPNGDGD